MTKYIQKSSKLDFSRRPPPHQELSASERAEREVPVRAAYNGPNLDSAGPRGCAIPFQSSNGAEVRVYPSPEVKSHGGIRTSCRNTSRSIGCFLTAFSLGLRLKPFRL